MNFYISLEGIIKGVTTPKAKLSPLVGTWVHVLSHSQPEHVLYGFLSIS